MKKLIHFILFLLFVGCSGADVKRDRPIWTRPVTDNHGDIAHIVVCLNKISVCYDRAEWVCQGGGYEIIERSDRVSGVYGAYNRYSSYHSADTRIEWVISCNGSSYLNKMERDETAPDESED